MDGHISKLNNNKKIHQLEIVLTLETTINKPGRKK
jgi:hypothetical protein